MFVFLSYKLDPKDHAWPGEPVLKVELDSVIGKNGRPCNSAISHVPNHFGTHFDAPRHFNPNGMQIAELPANYFAYKENEILLVDIPKKEKEVVILEDIEPYEENLKKAKLLLIRTGFEKFKYEKPYVYENEGPCLHPDLCKYLVNKFDNLLCVGLDFLSIGSPCNNLGVDAHQWLLGYHTDKFITAVEDMMLSPLENKKIKGITLGPLRIVGVDSSQVSVIAEIE